MPNSKKPRKLHKPKQLLLKANSAKVVATAIEPNRARIWFQNNVLELVEKIRSDETTVTDLDNMYRYALTHEAVCVAGFALADKEMYAKWDNAVQAAYRRGDTGLRYGFNPTEKEAVITLLFDFIRVLKLTPETDFFLINKKMTAEHNNKIQKEKASK